MGPGSGVHQRHHLCLLLARWHTALHQDCAPWHGCNCPGLPSAPSHAAPTPTPKMKVLFYKNTTDGNSTPLWVVCWLSHVASCFDCSNSCPSNTLPGTTLPGTRRVLAPQPLQHFQMPWPKPQQHVVHLYMFCLKTNQQKLTEADRC